MKVSLKSEDSKPFEVYLIESDDHWYVGCTTRTTPVRFAQHLVPSSDSLIGKLAKRGVKFSWSVLEEGEGTYGDRIQSEQRWYEEKLVTETRRTLNRKPPAGWRAWLGEGPELLLSAEFGQALLRAKLIRMAESALKLRSNGLPRNPPLAGSYTRSCASSQELAET